MNRAVTEEVTDITLSFLETAIHTILFARGVYPAGIFEQRRAFGVPCWMSRHPELNESIVKLLVSLRPLMYRQTIETLYLVMMENQLTYTTTHSTHQGNNKNSTLANNPIVEQYVFRISNIPPSAQSSSSSSANSSSSTVPSSTTTLPSSSSSSTVATYSDIDTLCGSAITALLMHEVTKPKVSKQVTWTILVQSHDILSGIQPSSSSSKSSSSSSSATSLSTTPNNSYEGEKDILAPGSNWIRVDEHDPISSIALHRSKSNQPQQPYSSTIDPSLTTVRSTPVKTIAAGPLFIQVAYEKGVR